MQSQTFYKAEKEWAKKRVCPRCGVTRAYPRDFGLEYHKHSKGKEVCLDCLDEEYSWDERFSERGY